MIRQGAPTRKQRPPSEWELRQEAEQRERQRNLEAFLAEMREARENEVEWYMWVLNGRPVLTEAEYALVGRFGRGRNQRADAPRNRGKDSPWTGEQDAQIGML